MRHEPFDLAFPIREQIDPLPRRELARQCLIGGHILDADRDDSDMMTTGENDLLLDFVRIVGVACEHQNHQTRVPQCLDEAS